MKKVGIQNLGMIVTNKCNLDCRHCERGCKNSDTMSYEVIKSTLDQIAYIGNLALCGGEITLAIDEIEKIFRYIVDNKSILVNQVTAVINGTIYSNAFLDLLDYIGEYLSFINKDKNVYFNISYDEYHLEEIKRLGLLDQYKDNIIRYSDSLYFNTLQGLSHGKLFKEGNALELDSSLTVSLKPMNTYITYPSKFKRFDKERTFANIGPLVTINPNGIITECDASIDHQESIYNYGNVLADSIEEVMLKRSTIVTPRKWLKLTDREIKYFNTYQN